MAIVRRDDTDGSTSAAAKSVWTDLTDAQRYSLIAIGLSALATALLWRGIPIGRITVEDEKGERSRRFRMFHILWPVKMMTVLFHEICHAIVGTLTCGRVVYIRVDPYEGGATGFRKKQQPVWALTLPAGYIGSCAIGCALMYCGFDAMYSKYATIGLGGMLLLCVLVCLATTGKIGFLHYKHTIRKKLAQWTGNEAGVREHTAKEAEWRAEWDVDSYDMDATISAETIIAIAIVLLPFFAIAWYLSDSIGLRFLILFIGTMSAVYAVADVCIDGILHGKEEGSDARDMAQRWHSSPNERDKEQSADDEEAEDKAITRWTIIYAVFWTIIQVAAIILTIYLALQHFRSTMAQQAYETRQRWATPNHWQAADTWAQAKGGIQDGIEQYAPSLHDAFQ